MALADESSAFAALWIPAFAGMTGLGWKARIDGVGLESED